MDADENLMDAEERMDQAVQHLASELSGLRSGRASPALVDKLHVTAYGTATPLSQLAQIGCPEPRQIMIKPYDPSIIKDIERAILASDLGLNPNSDGKVLRLNLPPLSEERRKQLAKVVKDNGEKAHISVRNVRRDANKHADTALKDKALTEDDCERLKKSIQELTKSHETKITELVDRKIKDLMEV
ncbi:MAG: ribosome recycling factor [Planctomycetota bacterium]|nr:ribosome recycling factor [Planctomycetota bacterium]